MNKSPHTAQAEVEATSRRDDLSVLDNLAWHALSTTQRHLAEGDDRARRFLEDVSVFSALADESPASWAAMAALAGPGSAVVLVGLSDTPPPDGWVELHGGSGRQMILPTPLEPPPLAGSVQVQRLEDRHVPQMTALVELAKPGPFRPRTIEMGPYFGVFDGDDLVAMAGERMRAPGFAEISAVCTHPSARRRGLGSVLTAHVAAGIQARGDLPLLHVVETNCDAQRVYEKLGFVLRRHLMFRSMQSPG